MEVWLSDQDANTLDLDSTIHEISFGAISRNFKIIDNIGSDGGQIRGFGNIKSRKFQLTRTERIESGDNNWINSRRNDFNSWFMRSRTDEIYLNVRNGEDTATYQTRVYGMNMGATKATQYKITDKVTHVFEAPKGHFENTTATTDTGIAIFSGEEKSEVVTNGGIMETSIICDFTPSSSATLYQVIFYDQYGFRLEGSFNASKKISLDTGTGELLIDGVEQKLSQFLTYGGLFNIDAGDNTLRILADSDGDFDYSFNERIV